MDQKKFQLIQSQIQEARRALQNWNDRRAEAMIELDSIFTEIELYKKQVTEENQVAQNTIKDLKASLAKNDSDFHKHFKSYTNDMQELKLENENVSRQLKLALAEIENQKKIQKKAEEKYAAKIAQMNSENELKVVEQQLQLKSQVTHLVTELQSIQAEKNTLSIKAEQYEKELRVIRDQMMSFLNVTKDVSSPTVSAPIVVAANALEVKKKNPNKLQAKEIVPETVSTSPTNVNDYLKRFGY